MELEELLYPAWLRIYPSFSEAMAYQSCETSRCENTNYICLKILQMDEYGSRGATPSGCMIENLSFIL